jgi:hypothetical protein
MAQVDGLATTEPSKPSSDLPAWVPPVVAAVNVAGKVADRFGVAGAVLIVLLAAIWFLGSDKTRDDFVRETLFGAITGKPTLGIFFGLLILVIIFGLDTRARAFKAESKEMKRLAAEKTRLQEQLLERQLSHTRTGDQTESES